MSYSTPTNHKLNPYDGSLTEDMSMYDRLTYTRNINLCGADSITLYSGNVIKPYQYQISPSYTFRDMDAFAEEKIRNHQQENTRKKQLSKKPVPEIIDISEEETETREIPVKKAAADYPYHSAAATDDYEDTAEGDEWNQFQYGLNLTNKPDID